MSIKKPCESWHTADISLRSSPLEAHSRARWLPASPHSIPLFFPFCPPCLSNSCSLTPPALSVSNLLSISLFLIFPFSTPSCSLSTHNASALPSRANTLSSSRTWRRSWSWIGGACLRLRAWLSGRRRSLRSPRRGCCCRRTSCRAEQVVVQTAGPPVFSPVWNAHIGENQLSSCISIIHSGSALIKFSPHTIIIYTGGCNRRTLFIPHKQFHQSVIIPSQQKQTP